MVSLAEVGEESLQLWKELVDLGDHVFVEGEVITSRRGELSILVKSWQIAAKAVLPLPNLHNELSEETRVRSRYLDLIAREQARRNVLDRAKVNQSLRATFDGIGFVEVETPMLQVMHGGASARPFVTHSNAFDTELYLRIAPELYLKRAVVGGIERVFEINRNFRNEGADSTHSPEFAMLEAYEAYGDYTTMADLTQKLIQDAALAVSGSHIVTWADGTEYDLGGEWDRISMYDSLSEAVGETITAETPVSRLKELADAAGIEIDHPLPGKYVEELWEHHIKPGLERPTFVMDFPIDTSPLVRWHRSIPRRRREVGPLYPRLRARDGLLRARRPPSCSVTGSSSRRSSPRAATPPRRCGSTRSSCVPSSSACRRRAAWAWASTACSWRSRVSASARRSCSRW